MSQGQINQIPPPNNTTVVVAQAESTSGLAIAGLVFNILGWLTCGAMSLLGVPLSFLALFARGPKGTAIAGLLVGFPGVIFFALMGASMILGFMGLGAASAALKAEMEAQQQRMAEEQKKMEETMAAFGDQEQIQPPAEPQQSQPEPTISESSSKPEATASDEKPMDIAKESAVTKPEAPPEPKEEEKPAEEPIDPKKIPRTWKDAAGKFSTEATFNGIAGKTDVFLKKADGKVVKVPIDKLSDEDKAWLQEHTGWKPE